MQALKVLQIRRDTTKFQFRSADFDESKVQWLVANWNSDAVDPLDVWQTPEGDFLLSGHHRHEAMLRLKIQDCVCRVHTFSLQDAQSFALKSNANRLQYTDFEYSRCVAFLIEQGNTLSAAANELSISPGMAKKYYSLRHLVGTDWERQYEKLDLSSRSFEIGAYCDQKPLSKTDLQSLFKVVTENELTVTQVKQLLRDIKKQQERASQSGGGLLFDLGDFSSKAVKAVKERAFLDNCAAQAWWLYELIQKDKKHEFPPELHADFMRELIRFYSYCVGSDEAVIPSRATGKGRKLRVSVNNQQAS